MKKLFLIIFLGWLVCMTPVQATIVLDLVDSTGAGSILVDPGGTISLKTLMTTTAGENVGVLEYTVALTQTDWTLSNRDYGTYGWDTDPFFDSSDPADDEPPTVIASGTFTFNTGRADLGSITGTNITIETFDLTLPGDIVASTYTLTLTPVRAFGAGGSPILTGSLGGNSEFKVIIPEPSSLLLIGTALLSFGLTRRRGMNSVKNSSPRRG